MDRSPIIDAVTCTPAGGSLKLIGMDRLTPQRDNPPEQGLTLCSTRALNAPDPSYVPNRDANLDWWTFLALSLCLGYE